MVQGNRCKHTKQTASFRQPALILMLVTMGWGGGLLLNHWDVPIFLQFVLPILLTSLGLRLHRSKQPYHTAHSAQAIEKAKIPFESTTTSLDPNFAEQTLSNSHTYQLQLLCTTLKLTTSAIILHDPQTDTCLLHSIHTNSTDTINKQIETCSGILLSLNDDRPEISGHPTSPDFQGLPYYKEGTAVGGFMAMTLKEIDQNHTLKRKGFLCVDRDSTAPWSEDEQHHIRTLAKKINIDLYVAEQLCQNNRDKKAVNQICLALQDLNSVLNLQEAFAATYKTVTSLTSATLVTITLKDSSGHSIVAVTGCKKELQGQHIGDETCLVNQAMELQRTMTPKATEQNPVTLFTEQSPIDTYESLLIIPLIIEENPIGTLIVGGKEPQLFSKDQQALLEVIAGQIATRIDLAQTHEQIQHMATIDGLTGLVNHRTFQNGLNKMLIRANRQKTNVALILCDIDHFKMVNDNYGHPFGDEVLRQVSSVLKNAVRSVDLAARYGGEEFTLVLENADLDGGIKLAERVRKKIEGLRFTFAGKEVRVTMSLGVSCYPLVAEDQATLISQADSALYVCKEEGRNQTRRYTTPPTELS